MYIKRVVIKNFRNLQNIEMELDSNLTCLVGENNSGKSNFLTALRLVLDTDFSNYYRKLNKEDFTEGLDIREPQQILIGVQFVDYNSEGKESAIKQHALVQEWCIDENIAQICYRFRPKQTVRQDIESGERDGKDLTIDEYGWELVCGPVVDENGTLKDLIDVEWDDEFTSGTVKFNSLEAFRVTFLPAIRDVEDDLRRLSTSPLHKLLEIQDISEDRKAALVEKIQGINEDIISEPEFQRLGQEVDSGFNETVGTLFGMEVGLGMSDPTFQGISRSLKMLLTGSGLTKSDIARNGLGLNNALYISMLLKYFERLIERDNTAGELLLVEEPEAHLHPQLQHIIFSRLIDKKCQVIASTHSTHITSRGSLRNLAVFTPDVNKSHSLTNNFVDDSQFSDNEIGDLERYLDATKSVLLFAKKVILVEGMSEVFLIPKLVQKVMAVDLESYGISVVPVHGVHFHAYLKLFGPDAIRKKCLVLTDGDLKPSDADEETETDDGLEFPTIENLKHLENDFVKIYNCTSTFERALAMHKNLKMFSEATAELEAPRISAALMRYYDMEELTQIQKIDARSKVLNTAKRIGKARFAQVVSKYSDIAEVLPRYIRDGISWIIE